MTNEKQEQPVEADDIREVRELFERLDKMKLADLLSEFEKQFYLNACAAIELFQKVCLNSSNDKKRTEAAKYLLSFLKDPYFVKNIVLVHELRGRLSKGAGAAPDAKADWISEPEPKKR